MSINATVAAMVKLLDYFHKRAEFYNTMQREFYTRMLDKIDRLRPAVLEVDDLKSANEAQSLLNDIAAALQNESHLMIGDMPKAVRQLAMTAERCIIDKANHSAFEQDINAFLLAAGNAKDEFVRALMPLRYWISYGSTAATKKRIRQQMFGPKRLSSHATSRSPLATQSPRSDEQV